MKKNFKSNQANKDKFSKYETLDGTDFESPTDSIFFSFAAHIFAFEDIDNHFVGDQDIIHVF